jgi:anti-sigma-K factor RskA
MSTPDHHRWEDDLAAWMLGALTVEEAERFEQHLAGCERCRADLDWLRPAVDAVPASVTQLAPPPRLRGRLLGTVRSEARRGAAPERRGGWRSWFAIPRPALAGLAATALIAAGIAGYVLRGDESETTTIQARSSHAAPGANAELVIDGDTGTLSADGLPELKRDQVFQAWVREEGEDELQPSNVFVPDRAGTATATVDGLDDAAQVMVTREPRGGSMHPTTAPLLRANLS